jgi:hypothetical protein
MAARQQAARGKCADCGNPPDSGSMRCARCAEKHRTRENNRGLVKRRICYVCRKAPLQGGRARRCGPCAFRSMGLRPLTPEKRMLAQKRLEFLLSIEPGATSNPASIYAAIRYLRKRLDVE